MKTMPTDKTEQTSSPSQTPNLNVLALASEVGFIIIVPLLMVLAIGLKLDNIFATKPIITIGLMPVALFVSGGAIWRKIKYLNKV